MRRLILTLAILLGCSARLAAQRNDPGVTSPNIENISVKQPMLEYALMGGFLLGAMAIGFKPSKRSKESA